MTGLTFVSGFVCCQPFCIFSFSLRFRFSLIVSPLFVSRCGVLFLHVYGLAGRVMCVQRIFALFAIDIGNSNCTHGAIIEQTRNSNYVPFAMVFQRICEFVTVVVYTGLFKLFLINVLMYFVCL